MRLCIAFRSELPIRFAVDLNMDGMGFSRMLVLVEDKGEGGSCSCSFVYLYCFCCAYLYNSFKEEHRWPLFLHPSSLLEVVAKFGGICSFFPPFSRMRLFVSIGHCGLLVLRYSLCGETFLPPHIFLPPSSQSLRIAVA